jgi:AcrR family transcriptional regulator
VYHYFPSKTELFKAAVAEQAADLQRLIEPAGGGTPVEQLTAASTRTWNGSRTTRAPG